MAGRCSSQSFWVSFTTLTKVVCSIWLKLSVRPFDCGWYADVTRCSVPVMLKSKPSLYWRIHVLDQRLQSHSIQIWQWKGIHADSICLMKHTYMYIITHLIYLQKSSYTKSATPAAVLSGSGAATSHLLKYSTKLTTNLFPRLVVGSGPIRSMPTCIKIYKTRDSSK